MVSRTTQHEGIPTMDFTHGSITLNTDGLPAVSIAALLKRGLSHYFGNEQAARVSADIANAVEDARKAADPNDKADATRDEIKAWRVANPEAVKAWADGYAADALKALQDGTIGTSNRGPRADPLEAAINSLAKADVVAMLKARNIKVPKGEEVVTFAKGVTRTLAQMIANKRLAGLETYTKAAQKKLAEDARRLAKAQEAAAGESEANADDLGL